MDKNQIIEALEKMTVAEVGEIAHRFGLACERDERDSYEESHASKRGMTYLVNLGQIGLSRWAEQAERDAKPSLQWAMEGLSARLNDARESRRMKGEVTVYEEEAPRGTRRALTALLDMASPTVAAFLAAIEEAAKEKAAKTRALKERWAAIVELIPQRLWDEWERATGMGVDIARSVGFKADREVRGELPGWLQDGPPEVDEPVTAETANPEAGYAIPPAPAVNVLWFSRHAMTAEQKAALGANVHVEQFSATIQHVSDIPAPFLEADVFAIVAPLPLQQEFLKAAGDRPVIYARNNRVAKLDGGFEFVFAGWERLVRIEVVTEPWKGC